MNKSPHEISSFAQSQLSETEEKEEFAAQFSHGTPQVSNDPTRTALHTGEDRVGSLETRLRPDGAPGGQSGRVHSVQEQASYKSNTAPETEQTVDQTLATGPTADTKPKAEAQLGPDTGDHTARFEIQSNTHETQQTVQYDSGPTPFVPSPLNPGTPSDNFVTSTEDENDAPEEILLDALEVSENAAGAVVGTLTVVDPDTSDTHSIHVSDDRFEVVGGQLQLKPEVTLDHEEAAQIEVDVTVTDSGGLTLTERFTVEVLDVNEAPDTIKLDGVAVAENAAGAIIGALTVTDPDADDNNNISVSDDRFEVVDGYLQLKPGVSLNYEDAAQVEVNVTATDTGGLSLTESFTIDVQDINVAPQDVILDNHSVAENAAGAVIGNLSTLDSDINDDHAYHVSDDRFEVVDGDLRLKPDVQFDHEETDQIELQITTTDSGGLSTTKDFVISIENVNEGPENLTLSINTDNLVSNGSFEEFDLDQGRWRGFNNDPSGSWTDSHGIEIWDQFGGTKASDGDQLMELDHGHGVDSTSQVIQTVDGQLYDLGLDLRERLAGGTDTVEVYWNGNLVAELDSQSSDWETFQLQVVGTGQDTLELREPEVQNDSYGALIDNITLTAAMQTVAENVTGAVVGKISFDDPDQGDTHRFEVSDDRFEVVDNLLRLKPGVSLDFEEAASVSVNVTVIDEGGLSQTVNYQVNVADMPDVSISSGFSVKFFGTTSQDGLGDVDWNAAPVRTEVVSTTDFGQVLHQDSKSNDAFGIEVSGNINVEEGGLFTFHLDDHNSATLVVDGVTVIPNGSAQTGEIDLAPGTHVIELRNAGTPGAAGPTLEWEGPGLVGRQPVTAPDLVDAQTVSGMPITFEISAGAVGFTEESHFALSDLPEGTQVETESGSVIAGPDGTVELSGWNVQALSITPPAEFTGPVQATLHHSTPTGGDTSYDGVETLAFDVNAAQQTLPSAQVFGGFTARFFDVDHKLKNLDDVDWSADPSHQELISEINFETTKGSFWADGSKDTFGAQFEGKITIEEGGSYTFFAGGDDGVAVYINGVEVVDNDGRHGFRTRSGEIELETGTYDIEVRYFENRGRAGLKLEWEGPDTNGREFVQADAGTTIEKDGSFELGIDLSHASPTASVSLEGLPPNTMILSGEDAALSDGGSVELQGWNIDMLEISPPPGFEGTIKAEITVSDKGFNGANISSETQIDLVVGHPDDTEGATMQQGQDLSNLLQSETDELLAWDAHSSPADDGAETDVMAETVQTSPEAEITSIQSDAYERVDW